MNPPAPTPPPSTDRRPPNIVLVFLDDLGWMDLGVQGSDFYETPHIDRLAGQGMRFTNAYAAAPVCSPSRAALLTGQYPARLHMTDWIPGNRYPHAKALCPITGQQLPLEQVTLAEALKRLGYATLHVGKWHLGTGAYLPEHQGFDVNMGGGPSGLPATYFHPYRFEEDHLHNVPHLHTTGSKGEYLTDRLTDEAIALITENRNQPFFLNLWHYAVHSPHQAPEDEVEYYRRKTPGTNHNNSVYAAMIAAVDRGMGRILETLDALGLAENTIVVFTSDNGGVIEVTSNAPLRAHKGTLYEGGIREPLIVRWPGVVPGGAVCDAPVIQMDLFPTLLHWAGAPPAAARTALDGHNAAPLLEGAADALPRDALFWHYPHYQTPTRPPCGAVRMGDWKLIEFYEEGRAELYNLQADIGEQASLAATHPEKRDELLTRLRDWRREVNAQMPSLNPLYEPVAPFARP